MHDRGNDVLRPVRWVMAWTAVAFTAAACMGDPYDRGYSDGYAAGYNTTCEIRSTLVEGSDNRAYQRGYSEGYSAGASACRAEQR